MKAALHRLEGRQRLRKAAAGCALVGAVVAGGWTLAHHRTSHPPDHLTIGATAVATAVAPAAARAPGVPSSPAAPPALEPLPPRHAAGAVHPAHPHGDSRAAAAPDVATRTFTLGPTPQNVDVYLDGEKQFAYAPTTRRSPCPGPSNHVIELRSPTGCCFVERIEVGPDRPLPPTTSSRAGSSGAPRTCS